MGASKKISVGIIGLGIIGIRVASILRHRDFTVTVWNRTPRAEPNFLSSARDVAESADMIQIFVRDGAALLEVIREISPALGASHIVMNHATVSPAETLEAARLITECGAAFLDAPFTGSRDAADEGALVYYVGGEESVIDRARSVLTASSKVIVTMGPVGAATYVKLATNMISATETVVLAEALALLHRGGVPLTHLSEALEHNMANSGTITLKAPLMLHGDFAPRFSVKNMLKDLQIVLQAVEGKEIPLPATAATAGALRGAVESGWGEDDYASVARHYPYAGSIKDATANASDPVPSKKEIVGMPLGTTPSSLTIKPIKKGFFEFLRRKKQDEVVTIPVEPAPALPIPKAQPVEKETRSFLGRKKQDEVVTIPVEPAPALPIPKAQPVEKETRSFLGRKKQDEVATIPAEPAPTLPIPKAQPVKKGTLALLERKKPVDTERSLY